MRFFRIIDSFLGRKTKVAVNVDTIDVVVVVVKVGPVVPLVVTTAGIVKGSVSPMWTCWTSSTGYPEIEI